MARRWPAEKPKETTGQPRMCASSTVRPAVEWTITSAAAIQSLICSVKPTIRTCSLPAKRCSSFSRAISLRPVMQTTRVSSTASAARIAPSRSPMPQPPPETSTRRAWAGTSRALRASPRVRGIRKSREIGGRIHSTLPGPASFSTSSIDSGWVT